MGYTERNPSFLGRRYPFAGVKTPDQTDRSRKPFRSTFFGSFRYAWAGVRYAVTTQRNFRVHLVAALGVVILGAWLDLSSVAWAMLLLTIGGVLVTEMFNTAAEALVDLVSPDYHPIAKLVKDLTAGAVLVIAFIAVVVGLIVLGPPLWVRLTLILAV